MLMFHVSCMCSHRVSFIEHGQDTMGRKKGMFLTWVEIAAEEGTWLLT